MRRWPLIQVKRRKPPRKENDMLVAYHDILCRVNDFIHKADGIYLDIGVGYLVKAEHVIII